MNLVVTPVREAAAAAAVGDVVSPELVLVDPNLAELARASLPPPDDIFTRRDELARARLLAATASADMAPPALVSASVSASTSPLGSRRSSRARSALFAGGVALALAISLLVGVRVDVGGQPAGADSTAIAHAPLATQSRPPQHRPNATKSKRSPTPPRTAKASGGSRATAKAPMRRRFAWAPTQGASGYAVEFFRGGTRVYAGHSARPTIEIPARWRYHGTQRSFRSGEYDWYVWPEIGGRRSVRASVQATLTIPHS